MTTDRLAAPPSQRIELRFSGTYYFVYQLDDFMSRASILTRAFYDEFHEGLEYYVAPFQRWTVLHLFAEFFIVQVIGEDFQRASRTRYVRRDECSNKYCPATPAWLLGADLMKSHGFDVSHVLAEFDNWVESGARCCPAPSENQTGPDLDRWDDIVEDRQYGEFLQQMTEEVFFVLFANRTFLHKFHSHLSDWVRHSEPETWIPANDLFRKASGEDSILKRARIPEWAKRAVFFRDRGRCCRCERDLGGTYSPVNRAEYDHIVPLALGGLNDVTNLQLLCKECNNVKQAARVEPSRVYERWFPTDRPHEYRSVPTLASVVASLVNTDETARPAGDAFDLPDENDA